MYWFTQQITMPMATHRYTIASRTNPLCTCGLLPGLCLNHCHVANDSALNATTGASGKYHSTFPATSRHANAPQLTTKNICAHAARGHARVNTP